MFEYRVNGTLEEPKLEPLFILPKIVLMPFRPFRSLKGPKTDEIAPLTNAPPTNLPQPPK
jgi:hypothetical protein